MRTRLLALVAAVAMVVVAVQVRARMDDRQRERKPRIVCATELAAVCDALDDDADVRVEPAGVTADRLLAAGAGIDLDGWVTPGPWAAMVRQARERESKPGLLTIERVVARSRLAIAVWPERLSCAQVDWACLVATASASDAFKLGLPDARRDALGLVALGGMALALAPQAPLEDDAFLTALDTLARAVPRPLPSFRTVQAAGPALADAYVTVEAGAGGRMNLAHPAPVVTADVVPARGPGQRGRRAAELLESTRAVDALRHAGWNTTPDAQPSGLPDVGVLEALRTLWAEVAR